MKPLDTLSNRSSVNALNKIRQIHSEEQMIVNEEDHDYDSDRGIVLHRPNELTSDTDDDEEEDTKKKNEKDSNFETHV